MQFDLLNLSLPAKSIILRVLLIILLLLLFVIFNLKVKIQCDLELRSLKSLFPICLNLLASLNNLIASSKLFIVTGNKSGIIKFPLDS